MTAVWGIVLVLEAVVRVTLAFYVSTAVFLVVSKFIFYGFLGFAIGWTFLYRKYARHRLEKL